MGKGWDASLKAGRRDRLRQEVLHRMDGGPPPKPLDYTAMMAHTPATTCVAGTPWIHGTFSAVPEVQVQKLNAQNE